MPNFVCSAPASTKDGNRPKYHRHGARYMVEAIFHDVAPGNYYIAGRPAPADQICIRGDTRSGKTNEQKNQMVRRIMRDVARASGGARRWSQSSCANFPQRISGST